MTPTSAVLQHSGCTLSALAACRLDKGVAGFRYLATSSTVTLEGVDDGEGLRNTLDAMHIIGLSELECDSVLQVCCALQSH